MSARRSAASPPRWPRLWLLWLLLLGAAPGPRRGAAFYLPGLAPVNFCEEDKKSDECKVGEARGTSGCRVGRGGWGPRGRGRSRGWGAASPAAPGAVRGRLQAPVWPCTGLEAGGLGLRLASRPAAFLGSDACVSAASVPEGKWPLPARCHALGASASSLRGFLFPSPSLELLAGRESLVFLGL